LVSEKKGRVRVSGNRMLNKILEPEREEVGGGWRKFYN
jgi:hypothetical protein